MSAMLSKIHVPKKRELKREEGYPIKSCQILHKSVSQSKICPTQNTSAESILTLKSCESIHFAKFAHDTCADTFFFEELIHSMSQILGKIPLIPECKVCLYYEG